MLSSQDPTILDKFTFSGQNWNIAVVPFTTGWGSPIAMIVVSLNGWHRDRVGEWWHQWQFHHKLCTPFKGFLTCQIDTPQKCCSCLKMCYITSFHQNRHFFSPVSPISVLHLLTSSSTILILWALIRGKISACDPMFTSAVLYSAMILLRQLLHNCFSNFYTCD